MGKRPEKKVIPVIMAIAALVSFGVMPREKEAFAPARMGGQQLIIDAGHGGADGGAVSVTGAAESGINLAVALRLDELMGFCGVAPILLRDSDRSLHDPEASTLREKKVSDIRNRVAAIEETEGAVVVSIHQNTFSNSAYHGAQVFYREGEESKALAALTQEILREKLDPSNHRTPAKIPDSVYLMNHITCPAILVECGFLSNPEEEAKLRTGGYQIKLAMCVASAWLSSGGEIQDDTQVESVI